MDHEVPIGSLASFWVVTKPRTESVLIDICFESTPRMIGYWFIGGRHSVEEVHGFYLDAQVARDAAMVLLRSHGSRKT